MNVRSWPDADILGGGKFPSTRGEHIHENFSSSSGFVNSSRRYGLALGGAVVMTTRKPSDSNDASFDISSVVEDFRAIEMLREYLATIGWGVDYRQLEAGQLEAHLSVRAAGGITIVRTAVSHRVIGSSRSPDDMFTIAMSVSNNALLLNGHSIDQEGLFVIPPKTDVHVSSVGGGWGVLSMLMSVDMLAEYFETVYDDHSLLETEKITLFELPKTQLAPLRRLVAEGMSQPLGSQTHAVEESDLVAQMGRLLVRPETVQIVGDPYRRLKKHRIVVRAKEYVHEHLREVIPVIDLCNYCSVSLSTLERIFTRELGIHPNGYIRAARLHEVRRALLATNAENFTIAEIAMNSGFTHMGRFSRRYRTHFGRLPSEERRLVNGKS